MSLRVLISAPYFLPVVEEYRARLEAAGCELIVAPVTERLEESALLDLIADVDGVICGDDRFTPRVIAAAPRLKVISKWGTGIDSIDREAAERRGIAVLRTPNAFTDPVADTTLGYILCFARRLPWMDAAIKAGSWHKVPGAALSECTLGVIGVGDIGRAVIRRALGFGMRVLGTDIRPIEPGIVDLVAKDELLARADYVSLHCDLNPTSHHLIDEAALAAMKPTAVLINTARGPVVKERALVDALTSGGIAGAALDVFEVEPLPADSELRSMPNVLLAPHNSNASPAAYHRVHENTITNLLAVLTRG